MTPSAQRLLILACSRRKTGGPDRVTAAERYDGPAFRLYRRYLRSHAAGAPALQILSAEFGLIAGDALIPAYDRPMTGERARELQPTVQTHLGHCLRRGRFHELFVNVGQEYLAALGGETGLAQLNVGVEMAQGPTGRRLATLYDWLYGPEAPAPGSRPAPSGGAVVLRGVPVTGDAETALNVARRGLATDPAGARRYEVWYVPVEGERVAPKWLVSRLTGLAAGTFHTDEARRILAALGVTVVRNSGGTLHGGPSDISE